MKALKCDQTLLMQYYDGELGPEKIDRVNAHLSECGSCMKFLQELQALSTIVKDGFQPNIAKNRHSVQRFRHQDSVEKPSFLNRIADLFRFKRAFIPALAMTVMLIAFFSVDTDVRRPEKAGEPSAIITSFSGDVSTVMFLETPETHQTIIWYKE